MKHQGGYGTLLFIVTLMLLSVGGNYYYESRISQPQSVRENYESAAEELRQINSALTKYYKDNLAWPSTLNELVVSDYFNADPNRCGGSGVLQSPFCTTIFGTQTGNDYSISVNLLKKNIAFSVANQVVGGSVAGTTVTTVIKRPFQSALYENYLQRAGDPLRPDRTLVKVDVDVNANDIVGIDNLNVATADLVAADIVDANIDTVAVEQVNFGVNSISYSGSVLTLNANRVEINGTLSLGGNVRGNNNNITGLGLVSATDGQLTNLTATSGTVSQLSGDNLDYNSGTVNNLSGDNLDYNSGRIGSLVGNSLNYSTGSIGSLSGVNLDYTNVNGINSNFTNLTSQNAVLTNATVDDLTVTGTSDFNLVSANQINGTVGVFDTISANTVAGAGGDFGSLNVTGSSSLNTVTANSGTITNLIATSANINGGVVNTADVGSVNSSVMSTIGTLNSSDISTDDVIGQNVNLTSGNVSGNMSVGGLTVNGLAVTNQLRSASLHSSVSSLGNAIASDLDVTGTLATLGINVSTASIGAMSVDNLSATSTSFDRVVANQFSGGSYSSNDDFYASASTVNTNFRSIEAQQALLDNCMFVTKACIPQNPLVTLSCPGCVSTAQSSSFSGIARASITQCRQGCNYSWVLVGSGLAFAGCSSGVIPKGRTANVACSVSANLGPQESANGSIRINVENSHYTSRTASDSVIISYQNSTPNNPFLNVVAGCFVDTLAFNTASAGSCNGTTTSTTSISFSIGESLVVGDFEFDNPGDWTISWSGACTGTGSQCIRSGVRVLFGDRTFIATASITHIPTGQVKSFSVLAVVDSGR